MRQHEAACTYLNVNSFDLDCAKSDLICNNVNISVHRNLDETVNSSVIELDTDIIEKKSALNTRGQHEAAHGISGQNQFVSEYMDTDLSVYGQNCTLDARGQHEAAHSQSGQNHTGYIEHSSNENGQRCALSTNEQLEADHSNPNEKEVEAQEKEKKINIWYSNADSIHNKMAELQMRIQKADHAPDIVVITESWPKNHRFSLNAVEIKIGGYKIFHTPLGRGRGICIYIRENLPFKEVRLESNYDEYLALAMNLEKGEKLLVMAIYRSPNSSDDNNERLIELLDKINQTGYTHQVILGDFNMPTIDWENDRASNRMAQKFLEQITENYWTQHVKTPTRCRGAATPNILDLVFTNHEHMIQKIDHHSPLGRSDHSLLAFDLVCNWEKNPTRFVKYFLDKGDYEKFRQDMDQDWEEMLRNCNQDIDDAWCTFKDFFNTCKNKHVPHKEIEPKTKKWSIPFNDDLLKDIKRKHRSWNRFLETRSEDKLKEYKKYSNKVRNLTRRAKADYEKNIAKDIRNNSKRFWQYVRHQTKDQSPIPDLTLENSTASDDASKADALNKFFGTVFVDEPQDECPTMNILPHQVNMSDVEFTEEIVRKKLAKLKIDKSSGPDDIHPKVLRELNKEVAKPLCMIFKWSYRQGKLPADWKKAQICAIHKKGPKTLCNNYRPVSLTSVVCKVMESIIRDHVMSHMLTNKIISTSQYGFIHKRSAVLQLLQILDEWTMTMDQGKCIETVYLDFQKAFDTVPHRRMMVKLNSYGITDKTHNWIEDFLKDRNQHVKVNNTKSSEIPVKSGIPQGSVLGPVLFIIYINDLPGSVTSSIKLFADDAKIYQELDDSTHQNQIQRDLSALEAWSDKWLLKFHPEKCKRMFISRNRPDSRTVPLSLTKTDPDGNKLKVKLQTVVEEKDLGVTFDNQLKFDKHIQNTTKKANRTMGIIRRTFVNLNKENFLPLYKALIRSTVEYGQASWSPYLQKDIKKIEAVQRHATKAINNFKNVPYPERLRRLNLPTLKFRRLRGDMIETYKMMTNQYDEDVKLNLERSNRISRGHNLKLYKGPSPNTDLRKNFFSVRIINIWNSLPQEVVSAPSINSFKNRLDNHWKHQPMKYDPEESVQLQMTG